jgi:hypothetical protein
MTDAHRAAISEGKIGKPLTEAQRAWMDDPVKMTEMREKVRQAKLAYWAAKRGTT